MAQAQFEDLERELSGIMDNVDKKIRALSTTSSVESRKALSAETDSLLDQAQRVVREMDDVIRSAQFGEPVATLRSRAKQYDGDIQRQRKALLTAGPATGSSSLDVDKFRSTYDRTAAQNASLGRSEALAADTEATGAAILTDLHQQRETLEGIDAKLTRADGSVDSAQSKLRKLWIKLLGDKIILTIIVIVQILIIILIVFIKWILPLIHIHKRGSDGFDQ